MYPTEKWREWSLRKHLDLQTCVNFFCMKSLRRSYGSSKIMRNVFMEWEIRRFHGRYDEAIFVYECGESRSVICSESRYLELVWKPCSVHQNWLPNHLACHSPQISHRKSRRKPLPIVWMQMPHMTNLDLCGTKCRISENTNMRRTRN